MPPFICPHLDIIFRFGPLNTKHTDRSTEPQDIEGLEILPWGVAGEAGSAQGRDDHRENPTPACQYGMKSHRALQ